MNGEFNKKNKALLTVWAIVAVIFVLGFAVVPFPKDNASVWISLVFTLISLIVSFFATFNAFGDDGNFVSKLYGFPIFKIGAIYAVVQIALSIVVFAILVFVKIPYWITLIIAVMLFGVSVIGCIATDSTRKTVETADENLRMATKTVETFRVDMASVVDLISDAELRKKAEKLADDFRFSDPMSSEATKALEASISAQIAVLKSDVGMSDNEKASATIDEIRILLSERNRICKANK